jgi:hypothetical protein
MASKYTENPNKAHHRYSELLRFEQMHERGGYYMPEDFPSLGAVRAELEALDGYFARRSQIHWCARTAEVNACVLCGKPVSE